MEMHSQIWWGQAPGTTTLELGTLCAALPTRIEAPHFLRVLPWVGGLHYNVPGAKRSARSLVRCAPRTLGYPSAYPTNVAPRASLVPCRALSAWCLALFFGKPGAVQYPIISILGYWIRMPIYSG